MICRKKENDIRVTKNQDVIFSMSEMSQKIPNRKLNDTPFLYYEHENQFQLFQEK